MPETRYLKNNARPRQVLSYFVILSQLLAASTLQSLWARGFPLNHYLLWCLLCICLDQWINVSHWPSPSNCPLRLQDSCLGLRVSYYSWSAHIQELFQSNPSDTFFCIFSISIIVFNEYVLRFILSFFLGISQHPSCLFDHCCVLH